MTERPLLAGSGLMGCSEIYPPKAILGPVGPEYSCSLRKIDMVKAMDGREFNNVTRIRCSCGTIVWCVAIQGLMCLPRMVVIQIRRHKSLQMPLAEHDDVVELFSAQRPDHSFRIGILPGRRGCRDDLVDSQTFNPPRNALTV